MKPQTVQVAAPSRLHFGMFAGPRTHEGGRLFGGVGLMIAQPSLRLRIEPADRLAAAGPLAHRALRFAKRWCDATGEAPTSPCHIVVEAAPPEHAGLGLGTQLGLSVAGGMNAFYHRPSASALQLAQWTGRGRRSAVGLYGFLHGGMIVEDGKLPGEALSPLIRRCEMPHDWRVVLIRPHDTAGLPTVGLHGESESQAFDQMPSIDPSVTAELRRIVHESMLPALAAADFDAFSHSVYQYGKLAGECFKMIQGGAYNGPLLAEIVQTARRLGAVGVGQSSWGPTIFCLLPDESAARDFVARMRAEPAPTPIEYLITPPANRGAAVEIQPAARAAR